MIKDMSRDSIFHPKYYYYGVEIVGRKGDWTVYYYPPYKTMPERKKFGYLEFAQGYVKKRLVEDYGYKYLNGKKGRIVPSKKGTYQRYHD